MYFPRGKKLKLAGIRVVNPGGEDHILSDPPAVQKSLRDYWGKVYAHDDMDTQSAETLFEYYADRKSH